MPNLSGRLVGAVLAAFLSVYSLGLQAKTYTPTQLTSMVASGNYPAQGKPTRSTSKMSFDACTSSVVSVVGSIGSAYPSKVVIDTDQMKLVKVWANDAAITVTCSAPDGAMVITKAPYL